MTSNQTLEILLDESHINYKNNRFKDAAASFNSLVSTACTSKHLTDMLYFMYRVIDAHSQDAEQCRQEENDPLPAQLEIIRKLRDFAISLLNQSGELANSLLPSIKDQEQTLVFMKELVRTLDVLDKKGKDRILQTMLQSFTVSDGSPELAKSCLEFVYQEYKKDNIQDLNLLKTYVNYLKEHPSNDPTTLVQEEEIIATLNRELIDLQL